MLDVFVVDFKVKFGKLFGGKWKYGGVNGEIK